jgi:hypothetical protein
MSRRDKGGAMRATITCPVCGTQAVESMPENACQFFYVCTGCSEMLKPEPGDCCVFCSYADKICPSKLDRLLQTL